MPGGGFPYREISPLTFPPRIDQSKRMVFLGPILVFSPDIPLYRICIGYIGFLFGCYNVTRIKENDEAECMQLRTKIIIQQSSSQEDPTRVAAE